MEKSRQEKAQVDNQNQNQVINASSDRVRFSDCCNEPISNSRCPACGNWYEQEEGRRELVIKGLDGKTKHGQPDAIFSMVDSEPKKQDKMPNYFKDLRDRGVKIESWTDSSQ
jgi:GH35 family endo-1,4-beta-xylanase